MTCGGTGSVCETGAILTVTDIDLALQEPSAALVVVAALGNFILGTALCFSISLDSRSYFELAQVLEVSIAEVTVAQMMLAAVAGP